MNIDEFIAHVAGEPARLMTKDVRVISPQTLEAAKESGGLPLSKLKSAPLKIEQRTVRYSHILALPASRDVIETWKKSHPSHPLPTDLEALIGRMNGIHLWANTETGRSHIGLAPIEEWEIARIKMYGPAADLDLLEDRFVALTYHQDGAAFVVLDVKSGTYFLMDTAGPDESTPIGKSAAELLEWLWGHRIEPK